MTHIPLVDLPGSTLLHDWLRGAPAITSVFDSVTTNDAYVERRSRSGAARSRLAALVRQGMAGITMAPAQEQQLEALTDPRSTVVVTGQQVGLFGGPFYTLLKIASAAAHASRLQQQLQRPVVPVFWLEDNDHDAREAATAHVVHADGSVATVVAWDGSAPRIPVASRRFSASEIAIIHGALHAMSGQFADEERARLLDVYAQDRPWTDAFLDVLQPLIAPLGVLVVRASHVVASGMHRPLVERDLREPGGMAAQVQADTDALLARGYHAQAQMGDHGYFVLDDDGRQRLRRESPDTVAVGQHRTMPYAELLSMAASAPERFSPTVLSRPIMQDAILPTIATVLGPAELAYHAQLGSAYQWFGVERAVPILRHSATLLDARTERLLAQADRDVRYYMTHAWDDIERNIMALLDDHGIPTREDLAVQTQAFIAPWQNLAVGIDPTLQGSVGAASAAVQKAMEHLEGKLRSALKRKHSEVVDRHKVIHTSILPMGIFQERILSITHWCCRVGMVDLAQVVTLIVGEDQSEHVIAGRSDLQSTA